MVAALTAEDTNQMIRFFGMCFTAWGRDASTSRLYAGLNMGLCAWLYRRTVLTPYSPQSVRLTEELFKKCLAAVAADGDYHDFLLGRQMRERDRSPAYARLRTIFVRRIKTETDSRVRFPSPGMEHVVIGFPGCGACRRVEDGGWCARCRTERDNRIEALKGAYVGIRMAGSKPVVEGRLARIEWHASYGRTAGERT